MPAPSSARHEPLSILLKRQPSNEDWLFRPVPWWQRWLAILVVGLFVVACVPLSAILVVSMALRPLLPASPGWRRAQATVLVGLCLAAEVAWFGGLVWLTAGLIL